MKAAIYYGPRDIRVEEIERPKAGEHGIVVKTRAAAICGTDLHFYKTAWKGLPVDTIARGHENAGDVVEVGANIQDVKIGDRVWATGFLPCFECERCKRGEYYRCRNLKLGGQWGLHGGFAEYFWIPVLVLNRNVIKLPETMSYQEGALIEPVGIGLGAAKNADPKPDDVAVVLGAGMVGLGAVATLKDSGVSKIMASEISDKRRQVAKELGADVIINPAQEDVVKRVMEETSRRGADIVVEAAGKPATCLQSMDIVRRGGKIVPVALYEGPFESNPNPLVLKRVIVIGGITADFFGAFELIKAGRIKDKQVVTHTFPLDKINEAFETAMNPSESIKVMIEP